MWGYTRIARALLAGLPVTEMQPADERLTGEVGDGEVFAAPALGVFAVYLPDASGDAMLNTSGASGDLRVRFFDPRTGTFGAETSATGGTTIPLGAPPSAPEADWVVLVEPTSR